MLSSHLTNIQNQDTHVCSYLIMCGESQLICMIHIHQNHVDMLSTDKKESYNTYSVDFCP